jgi:hypothetical protein
MKIKRWLSVMILAAWWSGSTAHGENSTSEPPVFPAPSPTAEYGAPEVPKETPVPAAGGLSDWVLYQRDCCEGKHGVYTPLYTELYVNAGPSFPVGGMTLSRELKTGWSIVGGARALFFNEPQTRAWLVDLHLINTDESAGKRNTEFPLTFFHNGTRSDLFTFEGKTGITKFSLHNANRALVGLGFGREWYPWQPAGGGGRTWRVGADGGGRWGSQSVSLNTFGHLTDVIGSIYAAAHTDVEIPCGSCLFHAGVRLEWAYTFSDVLQRTSDVQDISLWLTVGIRF